MAENGNVFQLTFEYTENLMWNHFNDKISKRDEKGNERYHEVRKTRKSELQLLQDKLDNIIEARRIHNNLVNIIGLPPDKFNAQHICSNEWNFYKNKNKSSNAIGMIEMNAAELLTLPYSDESMNEFQT
jgi:cell division ATPase FtsA